MFVDYDNEQESVPVRIDPEKILGFRKYGSRTIVFIDSMEDIVVKEEYEHFSTRLFTFIDEGEVYLPPTQQKKFLVRRKVKNLVEESYFDHNQPETNC
jgi:hypothetical protein